MSERTFWESVNVEGGQVMDKVRQVIREGNVRRIVIKQGDRTVAEFPLTVGVVGAVFAPVLAAVGAIVALSTECSIEIEREVTTSDAAPGDTPPANAGPTDTAATDPAPAGPAPVNTAPVNTAPADTAPADPAPADTMPTETAAAGNEPPATPSPASWPPPPREGGGDGPSTAL